MKKRMIVGVILAAVALGRVSIARAILPNQCSYYPTPDVHCGDALAQTDGFADAQKKVAEMVAEARNKRKIDEGLRDLGFKRQILCEGNRLVMAFGDTASDTSVKMTVEDNRLKIGGITVVDTISSTAFLSGTNNLELIRGAIRDLKAAGLVSQTPNTTTLKCHRTGY